MATKLQSAEMYRRKNRERAGVILSRAMKAF
jgi:hypothetical protein